MPGVEYIDIVNEQDEVIGRATRAEVIDRHLSHRIVHVLIYNSKGDIALQLRSRTKDFCPLYWVTSAGGFVSAGESYFDAAGRELVQELGVSTDLKSVQAYKYPVPNFPGCFKHTVVFRGTHDGPFEIDPVEVERAQFFSPTKVSELMNGDALIHPELQYIIKNLLSIKS